MASHFYWVQDLASKPSSSIGNPRFLPKHHGDTTQGLLSRVWQKAWNLHVYFQITYMLVDLGEFLLLCELQVLFCIFFL